MLILLVIGLYTGGYSQTIKAKSSTQTEQSLTKTAVKTAMVFNGKPVFKSSKGSYFVVKKSKSGNWYKMYVEIK